MGRDVDRANCMREGGYHVLPTKGKNMAKERMTRLARSKCIRGPRARLRASGRAQRYGLYGGKVEKPSEILDHFKIYGH